MRHRRPAATFSAATFSAVVLSLYVPLPLAAQTSGTPPAVTPPAQTTPQPKPQKPPPANATIAGAVVCSDTRLPARGAIVMAQPLSKNSQADLSVGSSISRVAMDGTYAIPHLAAGDYAIIALLPGYISPFDDLSLDQTLDKDATDMRARLARDGIVTIRDDQTAHFDISLERGAAVSGRVIYDDGAPATQIVVNVEDTNAKPPAPKDRSTPNMLDTPDMNAGAFVRSAFLHQTQNTDDRGNFRISGLRPGTYRISAIPLTSGAPGDPDEALGLMFAFADVPAGLRIYSGDTFHRSKAKTYDLHVGEDVTGIEITIPVYAFHRIQGHLVTLDGRPILSAVITLTDSSDETFVLHTRPLHDGGFVFPEVPSGTYNLAVSGAKLGTVTADLPDNQPIPTAFLQNTQLFADKTTTVIVKDDDTTDLSIQLQPAPPTPNQPAAAPPAAATSSDPD